MSEIIKSDIMRDVISAIIEVTGRRTFNSYIITIVNSVIFTLKKQYSFLRSITIHDDFYSENHELITISDEINNVPISQIAKSIHHILREVYNQLEDDAGLYFIKEIKEHLGNEYVQILQSNGIDFDLIQKEQHLLYAKKDRKYVNQSQKEPLDSEHPDKTSIKSKKQEPILDYSWKDVSTWKYNNNVCTLYKSDGSLLDKLELDYLVEDYVNRYTIVQEPEEITSTMIEVSKKEYEFLETIYSRDLDIDMAKVLLHISKPDIDKMVKKFLDSGILTHVTDNEVKLTRKGVLFLLEHHS
ncbi:MAG: hypothetical protein R6V50_03415 [Thermoplasmatota archaeon]